MNKTFKVIWNHATQSWVAVSELSKVKGKTKSTSLSKAIAIAAFVTSPVYAASVVQGDGATASAQGVALGDNAKATGDESPVAIGINAEAVNKNDIAIGNKAGYGLNDKGSNFNGSGKVSFVGSGTFTTSTAETISTHSNLAIGINAGANATGIRNIAIGQNATTQHFGEDSITIGMDANNFSGTRKNTDGNALAAGDTYRARRTIAIGKDAMTYGEESIAIGYGANTKQTAYNNRVNYTNAANAVALGRGATASGDSSFAQGYFASAQGQGDIAIGIAARTLLDPSLPNNARNFRIAIGRDAKIGEAALSNSLAIGSSAKVLGGNNAVALGAGSQAIGNNLNVALGSSSRTWGDRPNAIGNSNTAGGFDSSAIGAESHVLMRYDTNGDTSNNGVAVGAGAVSGNSNAVALGNAVAVFGMNSGALSASSKNPNAVNSLNLGDTTQLDSATNTKSPITIIGGSENFAIGNNNVIGSSSNNNMVMGNRIAVGATGATTNGNINIYRLAIKDNATGGVTAPATAYIKDGSNYYAFDRNASDYKGAQLDLTGKSVADEVLFRHIVPTFNNTKSINRAVAIGQSASVNDNDTIAIGTNSKAGDSSKAADKTANSIAIGTNSVANASQAIAMGQTSSASGEASVALGAETKAAGWASVALGDNAQSSKNYAIAVGGWSKATGTDSIAFGRDTNASATEAIAIGHESKVSGTKSAAIGIGNTVSGNNTFVLGNNVTAATSGSVVLGDMASTEGSHAIANVTNATVNGLSYGTFVGTVKDSGRFVSVGAKGDERKLINVAAGNISGTSTEAINGSQLYATNDTLGNLASSTKNLLGGDATLAPNGTLNMTNIGGTGKDNIHDAIAASITEVEAGTNIASVVKTTGDNGQPIYTVNADGASVSSGNPTYVTVTTGAKDANNITNYEVDLSQSAKDSLDKANTAVQNIVTQVNGTEVKTVGKDDNTMNFVNGNATTARADGTNITFDVETDNSTIKIENGKVAANTTTLSNNATTGVVETPTNPTALVNASTVADAINNAGFTLKTSATSEGQKDTSSTTDELITPGKTIEMVAGKNLEIKQEANGKITYATKENVTFTTVNATTVNATTVNATTVNVGDTTINSDGLTIKNGPSITKEGVNAGDKKITNVANGTISADSKDAVNGSQLYAVTENVTKNATAINNLASNTIKLGGDSGTTEAQALNKEGGLQFNVKGENGLTTSASGADIKVSITQSTITADENGNVTAGNTGNAYATAGDVAKAINDAQKTTVVEAGKNVTVDSNTVGKVTTYTVNAEKTTVSSNTDKLTVTAGEKDNNGVTNYAIDLSQETKDLIDNAANKDLSNITDAGKNVIKGLVAMEDGENTKVTTEDKNGVKTFKVDVTTTDIEMDGNAVKSTDSTAPVSAKSVANAINNSGFTLKTSAIDGGEKDKSSTDDEVITPNKTVEMIAGKNLAIKQEADGKITYSTKENVDFTTVNATTVNVGNTTINTDGLTIKNGPSITKDGVNAGNKAITNVANGTAPNDAVNVSQLNAAKSRVEGNQGVSVTPSTNADGSTTYTVSAKTDRTTIKIDANGNIAASTANIIEAPSSGNGAGIATVADEDKGKLATVDNVANAINSAGWIVNTGKADDQNSFDTNAQNHVAKKVAAGNQVNFKAGKNMEVKRDGNDIIYATSNDVSFNTVTVGNTKISNDGVRITGGPSMTTNGIDAGSKRITNVAPGVADTDAVNVSQLKGATANINNQLNKMDKRRKAGHASGLAAAGLMQAYREGQSAVTAGVAQYQNESAVAVGYSRIADSGKYGVKASFSANTQGEVGGAVSAGYFW